MLTEIENKMDSEQNESSNDNYISSTSLNQTLDSNSSINTRNSTEKNYFTVIDTNISDDTEVDVIVNIWVKKFEEDPRSGTIKLFTVIINCFDVDVCVDAFTNFNSVVMFEKITGCFKALEKAGVILSVETIKKSLDIQNTIKFLTSIFQYHSKLFFSDDTCKHYFMFLRDIIIKISQSDFAGPRLLATIYGLKIITGLLKSNILEFVQKDLDFLLKEFLIKRWKDTIYTIRETVLLELKFWIQIDPYYFLNKFWIYFYWALGDKIASIQIVALEMCKNILNIYSEIPNVKLLIKKILFVLNKLLLSKNEEVAILSFSLYSILSSMEELNEEQYMSNIESIALELIFSENSNTAKFAAKHFMDKIVNLQPSASEKLKAILIIFSGVPEQLQSVGAPFFVDAIYDLCPMLIDFEFISGILTENNIENKNKLILMRLLMYVVQRSITGIKPERKFGNVEYKNDIGKDFNYHNLSAIIVDYTQSIYYYLEVVQLHKNTFKKKEYTTHIIMHLLNQLKECTEPSHALSLWVLLQFIDFKLLQDKMILPEILRYASQFYHTWNIPTILEMVSKSISMISNLKGPEKNLSLKCIKDIAQANIDILNTGIENVPSLLNQNNVLIKIWSLAKYNYIPDDLEPLKYLSYYIPYLVDTQANLVVSTFALNAYMEILRKRVLNLPKLNDLITINTTEKMYFTFLDAVFNILGKCDSQVLDLCETAFFIVNELLRIKCNIKDGSSYELDNNYNNMLTNFIFHISNNYTDNDLNTAQIIKVYLRLVQDDLIDMNHIITVLQFIKTEMFECALRPIFNFFCKKESGEQLSQIINIYLVYMFENVISQKPNFKNCTIKDVINIGTIITRLLCQCVDKVGKRLVSTNIHRHGIQYAMNDTLNNPYNDYPFKQFFCVLTSVCDTLVYFDAKHLADYFINKPSTKKLIDDGNEFVLGYLYELLRISESVDNSFSTVE